MVTRKKQTVECYTIFPLLFWYPCSQCGQEFRRETGYVTITGPYYNGKGKCKYLCNACCGGNHDVACQIFKEIEQNIKNNEPPAPPVPPKTRLIKNR